MKVNISANTIQQIINADVVNIDQVKKLSADEQNDIINKLIKSVGQKSEILMKKPDEISATNILKLAEHTNNVVKDFSTKSDNIESRKNQISDILKNIKNCLGSTSDILFSAVKIAQILGIQ